MLSCLWENWVGKMKRTWDEVSVQCEYKKGQKKSRCISKQCWEMTGLQPGEIHKHECANCMWQLWSMSEQRDAHGQSGTIIGGTHSCTRGWQQPDSDCVWLYIDQYWSCQCLKLKIWWSPICPPVPIYITTSQSVFYRSEMSIIRVNKYFSTAVSQDSHSLTSAELSIPRFAWRISSKSKPSWSDMLTINSGGLLIV